MTAKFALGATLLLALVVGCSKPDTRLPGERLDLRDGLTGVETQESANRALPIRLPAAQINASWTHRNGSAQHRIAHPALNANLTQVFAVPIGTGNSRRLRITADPVVADGRIFTLDAESRVAATGTDGAALWSRSLAPAQDASDDATGGGLAVAGDRLFATTGFGALVALDAATGAVVWEQDLNAPGTSSIAVQGGLVYVMSRDSHAWAVDAGNGRVRWQMVGAPSTSNFSGGAGPAATGSMAIFPFGSGEVVAAFPNGGLRRWGTAVSGQRAEAAASTVSDIASDPVIDGSTVYVGNVAGRTAALDLNTGDRIWTATEGATGPVWPAGGSIFLVNDLNQLLRLDARDGSVIWRVALPDAVERRYGKIDSVHANYGPILAGGRLVVASSDGQIRFFDPVSGAQTAALPLEGGAASAPVVAGGSLYVVTRDGKLVAFR